MQEKNERPDFARLIYHVPDDCDAFTLRSVLIISRGNLSRYETAENGNVIYKYINEREYNSMVEKGKFIMSELQFECSLDKSYKKE